MPFSTFTGSYNRNSHECSTHAGVIRFRFVRRATPIKGADFGGAIFSLEPRLSSYSKGIEQLDTHLAVSRCRQKTFDDYTITN